MGVFGWKHVRGTLCGPPEHALRHAPCSSPRTFQENASGNRLRQAGLGVWVRQSAIDETSDDDDGSD
jgi:hypothetical protein